MAVELQLQIYLIIGVASFFILALILAVSLLSYYLSKLYKEKKDESAYLRKHGGGENIGNNAYKNNVYSNSALDLDDELNRRYTMHRSIEEEAPQPPSLRSFGTVDSSLKGLKNNKNSTNNVVKSKTSVIDVSEEFKWRQNLDGASKYNSSIIMHVQEEEDDDDFNSNNRLEGRTAI